jgi:hypothetical protein
LQEVRAERDAWKRIHDVLLEAKRLKTEARAAAQMNGVGATAGEEHAMEQD